MNWDELIKKVNAGGYTLPPSLYPTNRKNPAWRAVLDRYHEEEHRLRVAFESDLQSTIEDELGRALSAAQFQALYGKAWEDGHASGYYEVVQVARELTRLVRVFLETKESSGA